MIKEISLWPGKIQAHAEIKITSPDCLKGFPLLSIDRDSYIVQAEIQSGIDFRPQCGTHCVAIGKGCALANGVTFMIDLNHDYRAVAQGELSVLQGINPVESIHRKCSVIIQNDVWIGYGATIMAGIVLHNGCVVAAEAVVTKDVPPYAIVGGNPARILRYRFDGATIAGLRKIAWWDWPEQLQMDRREDFALPAPAFVEKYLSEAVSRLDQIQPPPGKAGGGIILFVPDTGADFPLYPKVFAQYFQKDRLNMELLIYLSESNSSAENIQLIRNILKEYENRDTCVTLQTGTDLNEHMLFQYADYYVTTRGPETVRRTCLADLYGTKILFGTDEPIFHGDM